MHLICHVQNSFYAHYLADAREQIQARFDACLFNDLKTNKLCIGKPDDLYLPIVDFQIKDSKSLDSAIIKLICKKESIAEQVLDLFGVRIITEKPADAILALEILRRNRIVIFANLIPSRSRNTLVNLHDFTQLEQKIQQRVPGQTEGHKAMDILELFRQAPASAIETSFKKHNAASHDKYRAIHLTPRQLIRCKGLDNGGESRIFFPYEIQIVDKASDQQNKSGDSAHARYKRKQLIQARRRILAPLLGLHRQQRENTILN